MGRIYTRRPVMERIEARTTVVDTGFESPCFVTDYSKTPNGYPHVAVDGSSRLVHVVAYEILVGPIPDGHEMHHRCETPACWRPGHTVPVTRDEHARIGGNAVKTHCKRGHLYDEANTHITRVGTRMCRRCNADRMWEIRHLSLRGARGV